MICFYLFNHPVVLHANLCRLEERTVKCVIKKTALCDLPSFCHISWDTNERSSPNVYSFQGAIKASVTAPHVNSIVTQSSTIPARELMEERKCEINAKRRAAAKSRIDRIDESLSPDLLQAVQQTRDKGSSSWLNAIPIEEHGLALNKQEFRDSLCLRHNLPLPNLRLVTVLVEKCLLSTMRCHAQHC